MKIHDFDTILPGMFVFTPDLFQDDRGHFFESWNKAVFSSLTGTALEFVQDNQSHSKRNVLRGLHYQVRRAQGKIVTVLDGTVFDVAVDMRRSSPTFGKWFGVELSSENKLQVWVPPGFAHGFLVRSATADVLYKTTDYYSPSDERCVIWNDQDIGIEWGLTDTPILSGKDRAGVCFRQAEYFE